MSAAIRAGRAFVEMFLKDAQLRAGLSQLKVKLQGFAASAEKIGSSMAFAGAAMLGPLSLAAKSAGDLEGAMSKMRAVFGDQADGTVAWMDEFTKSVGRGRKETADGLSSFQSFFVGMGLGKDEAANLSKEMVSLAVDFGSFHNIADPEAMQRFISAFSGSSEVLDMFGINIKATALDMKLLEMGFPKIANGATELQKVLARQAIIKESMGKQGAIGDAIRTASEFSNVTKSMTAQLMDMVAKIGSAVMPVFADWMGSIGRGSAWLSEFVAENGELVAIVAQAAGALTLLGGGLLVVGKAVRTATAAFATLRAVVLSIGNLGGLVALISPLTATLVAVGVVLGTVGYAMGVFGNSIGEVSHEMKQQMEETSKLQAHDQMRMKRLKQLSETQSLNNTETTEATQLIGALTGRYGDLGLSIDKATGKIVGMTEAQAKLSDLMKKAQILKVEEAINEAEFNVKKLKTEREDWVPGSLNFAWKNKNESGRFEIAANRERIRSGMVDEANQAKNLREQLAALRAGEATPNAGQDIAETARNIANQEAAQKQAEQAKIDNFKAGEDAAKELAKLEDDKRREKLTQTERDIEDAVRRGEERIALIDSVMAGEGARPGGPNAGVLEELNTNRDQVHSDAEADIAAIRKKAADEEAAKAAEARAGQLDEIARKEIDLKFAAKAGETEQQAAQREHDKRMAMIDLEQQQALADIKAGQDAALINRGFDLDKMLAEASINAGTLGAAEKQVNSAGSFNAAIVGRIGQDSLDKQQVTELQKQTRLLEKIEKKEGGIEFGPNW